MVGLLKKNKKTNEIARIILKCFIFSSFLHSRSTPSVSSPAFFLPGDSVRLLANQKIVSPPALNDIPGQARFLL
jgi:hypothetical protein